MIPGAISFKLYDTYGLALDEQEEMAREHGFAIDREAFGREMEQQRERARASWKGADKGAVVPAFQKLLEHGRTRFVGYHDLQATARVVGVVLNHEIVDSVDAGVIAELVLDQTPFYAEAGGQVGDRGTLYSAEGDKVADVETVFPGVPGLSVHRIVTHAPIRTGDVLRAEVAAPLREATMRNHTATHLLHAALRQVLGPHVKQHGSVVEPGRLRFDFTHYAAMDRAEIEEVERLMNEQILGNVPVETDVMALDQAISSGAMALFGEKYGEQVRVVSVPGFSKELCGGTHVRRTGNIGVCKIVSEGSISAGARRIEALTGEAALRQFQESAGALHRIAGILRASEPEAVEQVERLITAEKTLKSQLDHLKTRLAQSIAGELDAKARTFKTVKVLATVLEGMDRAQMRVLADSLRNRWKTAVVVLASAEDSNISIVSAVTKDLTSKVHAGKLVGKVAEAVGGKGGGRPDMAEGGGKNPAALPRALESVYTDLEGKL
jgi:alanyl-tRNA synthetase